MQLKKGGGDNKTSQMPDWWIVVESRKLLKKLHYRGFNLMKCDWQRIDNPQTVVNRVSNYPKELEGVFNTLKRLVDIPNAPGFEQGMARELVDIFKPVCDSVHVDYMGNVYGKRQGAPDGPVIYCPAHIDSVSFIVEHIEPRIPHVNK